jgi:hypothetical protein
LAIAATSGFALATPALADAPAPFSINEIVDDGHRFFGALSHGLAEVVQEAASRWGLPNAYTLGQEASGAFVGGLRYGEGKMYTRNAGNERVFWQGPSLGFDAGADGDRTMMLVYNLPATGAIFNRFGGLDGSAYFVGGLGFTALGAKGVVVVPIRTGLGWRLGVNLNYLKFAEAVADDQRTDHQLGIDRGPPDVRSTRLSSGSPEFRSAPPRWIFSLPTGDRARLEEQGAEKFAAALRRRVAQLKAFLVIDPNRWLGAVDAPIRRIAHAHAVVTRAKPIRETLATYPTASVASKIGTSLGAIETAHRAAEWVRAVKAAALREDVAPALLSDRAARTLP